MTAYRGPDSTLKKTRDTAKFIKATIWTGQKDHACVLVPGTNRCTACAHTGIPCTYTEDVCEMPELMLALWPAAPTGNKVLSGHDSKLVTTAEYPTFGPAHVGVGEKYLVCSLCSLK